MNLAQAQAQAQAAGLDRLETQLLLGTLLERDRSWLLIHGEDELAPEQQARFEDWLARRLAGEPLAYLVGEKEFHGLRLKVDRHTLVPRPDTEVLVDWALELVPEQQAAHVVDLGTGSGAIALALAHRRPQAQVAAVDFSAGALAMAQANGQALGLSVEWLAGSWFAPLAGRRFDLVVSNPPYIAGDDEHLAALSHEPLSALTPGGDGLESLREIVAYAPEHLAPGGWLLLEHGWDQPAAVADLLLARGFVDLACRRDLGGQARVSGGRWPG
ncbi:peptide chain release factor N(5)-glutamine methyltransferase [Pelomonas sp. SE-A7]|uniref:peptide chain release factor N(5)-glutamine methyltransferase n=1 Tax=Pelomonas sp. SE-A7 TaxID=3054953 RepID=UPI00259D11A9|nr:peptide chain release factor N(5)-glutamine methyltransferase [Pelomonas sp. SE-A7]MDM4767679.1 peptide chain release factor N(5)-glutamine methyltransferase [Pelomonas sp. SE-A7]